MKRPLTTVTFMTLVLASPLTLAVDDRAVQVEQRLEETKARLSLSDEQFDEFKRMQEERKAASRLARRELPR